MLNLFQRFLSKFRSRRTFATRAPGRTGARAGSSRKSPQFESLESRLLLSVSPAGPEFRVNTSTTGEQLTWAESPQSVAMDVDGDFVVTWTSYGQDGSDSGVYAQRYSAAGVAQGSEFQVNTTTTNDQLYSTVALDADGDFVVSWSSFGQDGGVYGVHAQRYSGGHRPTGISLSSQSIAENQPSGTTVGTLNTTDVDSPESFTYTLVSGPGSTDNASFRIVGNALQTAASFDYETQSSYAIRVQVTDAGGLSLEQTFTISIIDLNEAPTVSIAPVNDGQEGLSPGKFSVSQSTASATNTVVSYSVAGTATGVAGGVNDYTPLSRTVTILAGQLFADITVTVANDGLIEATETVILTLTSSSPGILLSTNAASRTATVNILDNDLGTVSIAVATQAAETNTPVNGKYRVTQTGLSTSPTVIHYVISGASTATPGVDVGTLSGTVTIPAGQTFADIPVPVFADTIVEATETLIVTLSSLGAGTDPEITFNTLPARLTATLNITDDDIATVSITKINDGTESSTPTHGLFRVTQTALSSTGTLVTYAVTGTATRGATADYTMPTGSITIPAGQLTADIIVTVLNDALVEANETVIITLSGFGPRDPQITLDATIANRTATVTITDDDAATVSIVKVTNGVEAATATNGQFRILLS